MPILRGVALEFEGFAVSGGIILWAKKKRGMDWFSLHDAVELTETSEFAIHLAADDKVVLGSLSSSRSLNRDG